MGVMSSWPSVEMEGTPWPPLASPAQVFHKIITSGHQRLQPLFDCLLTIIVNGRGPRSPPSPRSPPGGAGPQAARPALLFKPSLPDGNIKAASRLRAGQFSSSHIKKKKKVGDNNLKLYLI